MIGIASDPHGNAAALRAARRTMANAGCDETWLLGDLAGGAGTAAVVRCARDEFDVILAGNHDTAVAGRQGHRRDSRSRARVLRSARR